jgi:hypothetical protein
MSRLASDRSGEGRRMGQVVQVSRKPRGVRPFQGLRASQPWRASPRRRLCCKSCFRALPLLFVLCVVTPLLSCTHKIQVEAPKEPIVINLNVKIEHEVRIKVDDDLDELFDEDEELF